MRSVSFGRFFSPPFIFALSFRCPRAVAWRASVRDTSGAVLPGVTVEASSPALIERTRSVVTDDQRSVSDHRPAPRHLRGDVHAARVHDRRRDGVEVSGGGVITVNAEMRVERACRKRSPSPARRRSSTCRRARSREQVLSNETVQALPASRGYGNYLAAFRAFRAPASARAPTPANKFFTSRGGRSSEGNMQIDGMNVGSSVGRRRRVGLPLRPEQRGRSAGHDRRRPGGGGPRRPAFNIVPKTGGNTFSGTYFVSFAGEWAQGSNIDDELRGFGFNGSAGADQELGHELRLQRPDPARSRLVLHQRPHRRHLPGRAGTGTRNANAGNPNIWATREDESVKVRNANSKLLGAARLTWQATQRNKLGFYLDYTQNCTGLLGHARRRPVPRSRVTAGRRRGRASGRA